MASLHYLIGAILGKDPSCIADISSMRTNLSESIIPCSSYDRRYLVTQSSIITMYLALTGILIGMGLLFAGQLGFTIVMSAVLVAVAVTLGTRYKVTAAMHVEHGMGVRADLVRSAVAVAL